MAWFRMMGVDTVAYHRRTVLGPTDDNPAGARRYFGSRGETTQEWGGSLAVRLGLAGKVIDDEYDAVFATGGAVDPHLGRRLVRTRRSGAELVVSAHKSVAVLGVIGSIEDMHAILDAETDATMGFLDDWFRRQGGRRGRSQVRTASGGLLWARTRHLTSRAGDPDPHDHVLVANLTEMLDVSGGWKALDTGGLRDLVHAATIVGRVAAAEKAVELGYAIEADNGPSGKLGHWKLTGIPDRVLDLFSKRSREIDAAMESEGFETYRARSFAARDSRAPKTDPSGDLWFAWRDELAAAGLNPRDLAIHFESLRRSKHQPLRPLTPDDRERIASQLLAPDGPLTERKAFTRADVIRHAGPLVFGCKSDELNRVVAEVVGHPDAVALIGQPGARNRAWAVASVLDIEDAIAATADRLAARTDAPSCPELNRRADSVARLRIDGHRPTAGQAHAAHAVLTSGRGLDVIVGVAGSGKTTALQIVRSGFAMHGYRVLGTATSGQAARGLRDGAEVESYTIASLVHRLDHSRLTLDAHTVLLVDEVGMTDDRSLLRLITAVETAGAKAVIIGDHRQLSAVGAGGGLEALIDRHPDAVHVLDQNVRQPDSAERAALEHLRAGDPTVAVDWYASKGRIATAPTRSETIAQAVEAWSHDRDDGLDTVLLAWRRADVAALNQAARADQITKGLVTGPEIEAPGSRRYATGDQVVMLAPDHDGRWVTSERGTISAVEVGGVTVRFDADRSVTLTGVEMDDDHLDHAYAVTVHRTQGATVDTAHVLADGGGRELAYVAMSRARGATHVHAVADDLDQAREDLAREWATERRDRWLHDIDRPATEGDRLLPALARKPDAVVREFKLRSEVEDLTEALDEAAEYQRKVDALTRRLDAIQNCSRPPDRGIGIGGR